MFSVSTPRLHPITVNPISEWKRRILSMLFSLLTSQGSAGRKSLSLGAAASLSPWSVLPGIACTCQNALPGKRPTWFQTCIWSSANCSFLRVITSRSAIFTAQHLLPYWRSSCPPRRSSTSQRKNSFRSSLKKAGTVFLTYPGHPSFCGKPQGTRTVWINACMNHWIFHLQAHLTASRPIKKK